MDPLNWTGAAGAFLNPLLTIAVVALLIMLASSIIVSSQNTTFLSAGRDETRTNRVPMNFAFWQGAALFAVLGFLGAIAFGAGPSSGETALARFMGSTGQIPYYLTLLLVGVGLTVGAKMVGPERVSYWTKVALLATIVMVLAYIILGILTPYGTVGIVGEISRQLLPVWIALIATFVLSIIFKRKLGLYGKLFDSLIGMIGFGIVMFWVFTAIFVGFFDLVATHDALEQVSGMKNKAPGFVLRGAEDGDFPHYLLGGDNLARDVFSRVVSGAALVMVAAPLATIVAFMVGITLGLPAGYYGGEWDTVLSFLANLILAFPVILLFYLLVTPEILATGLPSYLAIVLFAIPLVFIWVAVYSRFRINTEKTVFWLLVLIVPSLWVYLAAVSQPGTKVDFLPNYLDWIRPDPGILVVFVAVVFVNSPTVFRIVRSLALDIKTRDYVAAAQTRGEGPWYIMLWEILPNARGPLIVDFCLRIGYTTILFGTLGFFGLGFGSESQNWGSTINEGRKLLSIYLHPALPPALSLLSLVLGLNLLADGLREESLKD